MPRAIRLLVALAALAVLAAPARAAEPGPVMEGQAIADINVDAHDARGLSPLMRAAIAGRSDWLVALRQAGAPLDDLDRSGKTALIHAASRGHLNAVRTLLDLGADFNYVDADGYSALMRATAAGHLRVVRALLEEGASPISRSHEGRSALAIARQLGNRELLALFHADGDTIIAGSGANPVLKRELAVQPLYGADEDAVEPQTPGEFVAAYLAALKRATGVQDLGPLLSARAKRAFTSGSLDQLLVRTAYGKEGAKRSGPAPVSGKALAQGILEMARAVNHRQDGDVLRIRRQAVQGERATVWYEIRRAKEAGVMESSFQLVREGRNWKLDLPGASGVTTGTLPAVAYPAGAHWRASLAGVAAPGFGAVGRLHGISFRPDHAALLGTQLQFEQHLPFATNVLQVFLARKGLASIANHTIEVAPGSWRAGVYVDVNAPRAKKSLWWYQDSYAGQGAGDYQMKLVCGNAVAGHMPVRIYLCLPDREHSFLAGSLTADVSSPADPTRPEAPTAALARRPAAAKPALARPAAGLPALDRPADAASADRPAKAPQLAPPGLPGLVPIGRTGSTP